MIRLPIPAELDGGQLAAQVAAAGFTNVTVSVIGDVLCVDAAELVSGLPTDEERQQAVTKAVADLEAAKQQQADTANAAAIASITPIVANFKPVVAEPPTAEEKLAALGLTPDDLKALLT